MPFVPASPPQTVWIQQYRASAAVDTARHYLYGAIGSAGVVVVNTADGSQVAQFPASISALAIDASNGDVYFASVSNNYVQRSHAAFKFDTSTKTKSYVELPSPSEHIALDSALHRLYVAEYGEKVTRVFVVDTTTMSHIGTIITPVNEFGNISIDPDTHEVYIAQMDVPRDYLVADASSLKIVRTVRNPELRGDGFVIINSKLRHVYRTDFSGKILTYDERGQLLGSKDVGEIVQQCNADAATQNLYCWSYHMDPKTYEASHNRLIVLHDDGNGNLTQTDSFEQDFIGEVVDTTNHLLWTFDDKKGKMTDESFRLP